MSEELPALPQTDGWLSTISQYHWLGIPGAVQAVSKVVEGVGMSLAEWIKVIELRAKQKQLRISNDIAAEEKISASLAEAAAQNLGLEKPLVESALQAWLPETVRKQEARNKIALRAVELLESPIEHQKISEGSQSYVEEDWLNVFVDHASRASSDRMRELWARVLAGEIRKPNAFSLMTLHFLSILDQNLAREIAGTFEYVCKTDDSDYFLPAAGPFKISEGYGKILKLRNAGIFHDYSSFIPEGGAGSKIIMIGRRVRLTVYYNSDSSLLGWPLSDVGLEIYNMLDVSCPRECASSFATSMCDVMGASADVELL